METPFKGGITRLMEGPGGLAHPGGLGEGWGAARAAPSHAVNPVPGESQIKGREKNKIEIN